MRFFKKFRKDQGGASALEFALVFPVFASMMFGTIQVGLAYYYAGSVQYVLERTARTRMVTSMSASQLQAAFNTQLANYTTQSVTLNYSVDSSGDVPIATFSANYAHTFVIPFVPSFSVTFPVATKVPVTAP